MQLNVTFIFWSRSKCIISIHYIDMKWKEKNLFLCLQFNITFTFLFCQKCDTNLTSCKGFPPLHPLLGFPPVADIGMFFFPIQSIQWKHSSRFQGMDTHFLSNQIFSVNISMISNIASRAKNKNILLFISLCGSTFIYSFSYSLNFYHFLRYIFHFIKKSFSIKKVFFIQNVYVR